MHSPELFFSSWPCSGASFVNSIMSVLSAGSSLCSSSLICFSGFLPKDLECQPGLTSALWAIETEPYLRASSGESVWNLQDSRIAPKHFQ